MLTLTILNKKNLLKLENLSDIVFIFSKMIIIMFNYLPIRSKLKMNYILKKKHLLKIFTK